MTERAPIPAPLSLEEQDAALRSRVAFNDRPLKFLHKKLSGVVLANGEAELAQAMTSFRLDLEAYILQLQRIEAVAHQTTVSEVEAYKEKVISMEQERIDALQSIEMLKKELVDVQQDRKNKLEYDALASEIMKYGTREELENQLVTLRTTLDSLSGESTKYSDIMTQSKSRFGGIAEQLKALRADVGYEVGERERREVERDGEGDAEEESRAGEEAVEAAAATERAALEGDEEQGEGHIKSGRSSLNPSATIFKPTTATRDSTPRLGIRGSADEVSSRKRRVEGRAEEEGEADDEESSKKRAREEGEMSEGKTSDEEEEGAA